MVTAICVTGRRLSTKARPVVRPERPVSIFFKSTDVADGDFFPQPKSQQVAVAFSGFILKDVVR